MADVGRGATAVVFSVDATVAVDDDVAVAAGGATSVVVSDNAATAVGVVVVVGPCQEASRPCDIC